MAHAYVFAPAATWYDGLRMDEIVVPPATMSRTHTAVTLLTVKATLTVEPWANDWPAVGLLTEIEGVEPAEPPDPGQPARQTTEQQRRHNWVGNGSQGTA